MDTAGESPAKQVKRTHRGQRSSAAQKNRDQRNKEYFPGSFAFAELAQNYGTASCSVDPAGDGNDRSTVAEREVCGRQLLEAHRTAGQMPEERMSRTEASVRDTSPAGGNSAAWAQEAPGADDGRFGFGAFAARYQPVDAVIGPRCFVPGQDVFNEDECKKSSDQWRHDLEMRVQWLNWIFDSMTGQVLS